MFPGKDRFEFGLRFVELVAQWHSLKWPTRVGSHPWPDISYPFTQCRAKGADLHYLEIPGFRGQAAESRLEFFLNLMAVASSPTSLFCGNR